MADGTVPAGPWVLVVGMHRSGTSAVTGALGALGLHTPTEDDRMSWPESNPEHWESLSLTLYNDALLGRLGGSWEAPPELPPGWEEGAADGASKGPGALVASAFPAPGPIVWKDPRLCLLLPYWRGVLPPPLAAVMVWRSPDAVADSLARRDGMERGQAVALWERYNRSALSGLEGLDTYVEQYETIVARPEEFVGAVSHWLEGLDQLAGTELSARIVPAVATLDTDSHAPMADPHPDIGPLLLEPHRHLMSTLQGLRGGHRPLLVPDLGTESPWTAPLLAALGQRRSRELALLDDQLAYRQQEIDRLSRLVGAMQASTSWRLTAPVRWVAARRQARGRQSGPGSDGGS